MNNERKTWSLKDSNYAWERSQLGMSNEDIAQNIGRTAIAVGVHLSKKRTKYHAVGFIGSATPDRKPSTRRVSVPAKLPLISPMMSNAMLCGIIGILTGAILTKWATYLLNG